MRVILVPSQMPGVEARCHFCGQWFPVGNVIGKVVLDEGGSAAGDAWAAQLLANRETWHDWGVCAECWTGNAETIRQGAARRARDLVERSLAQVRLVEAIRTTVIDLPHLTMEQYIEVAFPMSYPPELQDEDPAAASR